MGAIPGLNAGTDAPVFAEPWQAEVFAMVVALHAAGMFTWSEWAAALSSRLAASADVEADGSGYYAAWTGALEDLLAAKGVAEGAEVDAMTAAWHRAAEATPHGQPIQLENDPQHP